MVNLTKSFGRLLILVGIIGFVIGIINERSSYTALIPAVFGIIFLICAYVGAAKENLRKHMMHLAVLVGFVGLLAVGGRLGSKITEISFSPAYVSQIITGLLFLAFIILAVRSFIAARKAADS